jgi:hypothetical protein
MPEYSLIRHVLNVRASDLTMMKNLTLNILLDLLPKLNKLTLRREESDHLVFQLSSLGLRIKNLSSIRLNHQVHTLYGEQMLLEETQKL